MSSGPDDLIARAAEARRKGDRDDVLALAREAAESASASGDATLHAEALELWASAERDLGRLDQASMLYGEAIAILRNHGDPQRLAHALRHAADTAREQGRKEVSVAFYNESLAILRGDEGTPPETLANVLRGYALLREELEERAAASLMWDEARRLYAAADIQAGVDEAKDHLDALTSFEDVI